MGKTIRPWRAFRFGRVAETFWMNATPDHCSGPSSHMSLFNPSHPLYLSEVRRRWAEHQSIPLWWRVSMRPDDFKQVVISWSRRRLRNAFKEALAARGIDTSGRALGPPAAGARVDGHVDSPGWTSTKGTTVLQGTVLITATEKSVETKYTRIQAEMSEEVDYLVHAIGPKKHKPPRFVSMVNRREIRVGFDRNHGYQVILNRSTTLTDEATSIDSYPKPSSGAAAQESEPSTVSKPWKKSRRSMETARFSAQSAP